jgi:methylase of polypeptide subunit release factors
MAPSPAESRPAESGEELSAAFLERLKAEPLRELTVLDAGTGSGRVALALAPLCRTVLNKFKKNLNIKKKKIKI